MKYYIYILTNATHSVLYVGVTGDLRKRVIAHCNGEGSSFTRKYHINQLVYYGKFDTPTDALEREKQLKRWRREKKIDLIERMNPLWENWSDSFF